MPDRFAYDVFLSHNSKDEPRLRRLAERLKEAGLRVWLDEWNVGPGDAVGGYVSATYSLLLTVARRS